MPATPTDIAAAGREAAISTWQSAMIAARYPTARDGTLSPSMGLFDSAADAQTVVNARGTLIGTERRRFAVLVQEVIWPEISVAIPTMTLIDGEQSVNDSFLAARIELDLEPETTNLELFG